MRHVQGSSTERFVQGLNSFYLGYSGRKLRHYSERRLKKLGLQRSDLPTGITPTSRFL